MDRASKNLYPCAFVVQLALSNQLLNSEHPNIHRGPTNRVRRFREQWTSTLDYRSDTSRYTSNIVDGNKGLCHDQNFPAAGSCTPWPDNFGRVAKCSFAPKKERNTSNSSPEQSKWAEVTSIAIAPPAILRLPGKMDTDPGFLALSAEGPARPAAMRIHHHMSRPAPRESYEPRVISFNSSLIPRLVLLNEPDILQSRE